MKKIILFLIFAILSIPMTSLPMARFASSKLGKSAFVSLAALISPKLRGWFGPDDEEKYLPQIPTHPSYPYNEEGIALERLCLQSPSVNEKESDWAKERKARELAQKVHGKLPGSEAHRIEKYPFETGDGSCFCLMPGCWSKNYQHPMREYINPWLERKPLKPENIYATHIPGEKEISEVRATIKELSTQSFKPTRQSYEEALKKYTADLEQEKNKYFWQGYDEQKVRSLESNIKHAQNRINEYSILGSTQEEVALLQAAAFIRKDLLIKHLINHSEWEKQKNEIEKQREEIKEYRKKTFDIWTCCTN